MKWHSAVEKKFAGNSINKLNNTRYHRRSWFDAIINIIVSQKSKKKTNFSYSFRLRSLNVSSEFVAHITRTSRATRGRRQERVAPWSEIYNGAAKFARSSCESCTCDSVLVRTTRHVSLGGSLYETYTIYYYTRVIKTTNVCRRARDGLSSALWLHTVRPCEGGRHFVETETGNNLVLVRVDNFAESVPFYAVQEQRRHRHQCVRAFVQAYGLPRRLISDRGTRFTAKIFQTAYCCEQGIEHTPASSRHPRTNGRVQRAHECSDDVSNDFRD